MLERYESESEGVRTFVIEPIDTVDARALVVPAEDEEVLRVLDLVRKEQTDRLERLLASVHVIAQEEVVGLWRKTTVLEQPEQVVVLAVDVACTETRPNGACG